MDSGNRIKIVFRLVCQGKQPKLSYDRRTQKLLDEGFIAIVGPGVLQDTAPVFASCNFRKPFAVFFGRIHANAPDVVHHCETKRVGVNATIALIVVIWLRQYVGMAVQDFQHRAFRNKPFVVKGVHNVEMHKGGAAFVHDLGLFLRIEVLREITDNAQNIPLPSLQIRAVTLDEVQQILPPAGGAFSCVQGRLSATRLLGLCLSWALFAKGR